MSEVAWILVVIVLGVYFIVCNESVSRYSIERHNRRFGPWLGENDVRALRTLVIAAGVTILASGLLAFFGLRPAEL